MRSLAKMERSLREVDEKSHGDGEESAGGRCEVS
jgi:hypothetical protein